jgi:hypothetical protein
MEGLGAVAALDSAISRATFHSEGVGKATLARAKLCARRCRREEDMRARGAAIGVNDFTCPKLWQMLQEGVRGGGAS